MAIAQVAKTAKGFKLCLWNNRVSSFGDIVRDLPDSVTFDFHSFEVTIKLAADITSLSQSQHVGSCEDLFALNLSGNVSEYLCKILKSCPNLKSLCYYSFGEPTKSFACIFSSLKYCRDLHTLVLPCMEARQDVVELLANFLWEHRHLQRGDISHFLGMTSYWFRKHLTLVHFNFCKCILELDIVLEVVFWLMV